MNKSNLAKLTCFGLVCMSLCSPLSTNAAEETTGTSIIAAEETTGISIIAAEEITDTSIIADEEDQENEQALENGYTKFSLGIEGKNCELAKDINDEGQVVGYYWNYKSGAHQDYMSFIWDDKETTFLKPLAGYSESKAYAINEEGVVVGSSVDSVLSKSTATLWKKNGKPIEIGSFSGNNSYAVDVNDSNVLVGNFTNKDGETHAFLWKNNKIKKIGIYNEKSSCALKINNKNQVLGTWVDTNGKTRSFIYTNGKTYDLGTLGGAVTIANAINNKGEIVGESTTTDGKTHAFLWKNKKIIDLGVLNGAEDSQATSINDKSVIVGYSSMGKGIIKAFIWKSKKMTELTGFDTASGIIPEAINNNGTIFGKYKKVVNQRVAYGFVWEDGIVTDLGSTTYVAGVNNEDEVITALASRAHSSCYRSSIFTR